VVEHHVEHDLHAARVHRVDQRARVVERSVLGRDVEVVADVVAEVGLGAVEEGRDPERLDAQLFQVGQLVDDAAQVADAVPVGVGEGARIDLVDGGVLPPGAIGRARRARNRWLVLGAAWFTSWLLARAARLYSA
jgi:hypothetical protein